eukprot:gene13826-18540_t
MNEFRVVVLKKKKKVNRRPLPPLLPKPKIIKSDIRRLFPKMFCNVFNSCSSAIMSSYLNTYYLPSALYNQTELSACSVEDRYSQLEGLQDISTYWGFNMTTAPDLIFSIDNIKIKVRSDHTSSISCSFKMMGTKLIPMGIILAVDEVESLSTVNKKTHSDSIQSSSQYSSNSDYKEDNLCEDNNDLIVCDNKRSENEYNNNDNNNVAHNYDNFDDDLFDILGGIDEDSFSLNNDEHKNNQTQTQHIIDENNNNGVTADDEWMNDFTADDINKIVESFSSEDDSSSINTNNKYSNVDATADPFQSKIAEVITENESNLSNGLQTILNQMKICSADRLKYFVRTNRDYCLQGIKGINNDKMNNNKLNQIQIDDYDMNIITSSLLKIKLQFSGEMTLHVDEDFRVHNIEMSGNTELLPII